VIAARAAWYDFPESAVIDSIREFRQILLSHLHKILKVNEREIVKSAKKEKGSCQNQLLVVV
jgi:hypothetical protein